MRLDNKSEKHTDLVEPKGANHIKSPENGFSTSLNIITVATVGIIAMAFLGSAYNTYIPRVIDNISTNIDNETIKKEEGEVLNTSSTDTISPSSDLTEYITSTVDNKSEATTTPSKSGSVTLGLVVNPWLICNKEFTRCTTNVQCGDVPCEVTILKEEAKTGVKIVTKY